MEHEETAIVRRPRARPHWLTIVLAIIPSMGTAVGAYLKGRAEAHDENAASYSVTKVQVDMLGKTVEQMQLNQRLLTDVCLQRPAVASTTPTVPLLRPLARPAPRPIAAGPAALVPPLVTSENLLKLSREQPAFQQKPLPEFDAAIRTAK